MQSERTKLTIEADGWVVDPYITHPLTDLLSGQIKATITKRILIVPGWLSHTFYMFQDALQEMVMEEFAQQVDCQVHNMIKVKGQTVHIV